MKEPFLSALPLIHEIEAAGYEACFVGGAVRDFCLAETFMMWILQHRRRRLS